MRLFAIGYEGVAMGEFLSALKQAGVERVIDVRAVPNSRRPGFSKTPLRNALAEEGIDYVHLRALGTPAGREAARAGRRQELERIYSGQLETPQAIAEGAIMLDLASKRRAPCSITSATPPAATAPCCGGHSCRTRTWSICTPKPAGRPHRRANPRSDRPDGRSFPC